MICIFPSKFASHCRFISIPAYMCLELIDHGVGIRGTTCITPSRSAEKASIVSPARRQHPHGCNSLSHWPSIFKHLVRNTKQSRISSLSRLQTRPASLRSYFSSFFHFCCFSTVVLFYMFLFYFGYIFYYWMVFKFLSNREYFLQICEHLLNSCTF